MGIGETYERAPRLAPTRLFSHARPGTSLAEVCCTSGVASVRGTWLVARPATVVQLERRAVSAHAVPKAEGANQRSEFAPSAPYLHMLLGLIRAEGFHGSATFEGAHCGCDAADRAFVTYIRVVAVDVVEHVSRYHR